MADQQIVYLKFRSFLSTRFPVVNWRSRFAAKLLYYVFLYCFVPTNSKCINTTVTAGTS